MAEMDIDLVSPTNTQAVVRQLNQSNLPKSLKRMFEEALKEQSKPAAKKQNVDTEDTDEELEIVDEHSTTTDTIRIEVSKVNGVLVSKEFTTKDLNNIWEKGFLKHRDELTGVSQYRLPSGPIRLIYSLVEEVKLEEYVTDPFFNFVKEALGDSLIYTCKVLDLSKIPLAEIGSEVTIIVRHTHREVTLKQIDDWMKTYGTLVTESRFGITDGLANDIYSVKAKLNFLIPEYLPIQGKRARIYYHGIPSFCVRCYSIGHQNTECFNDILTWPEYIQKLKDSGIPDSFFGTWEELNHSAARPQIKFIPQPNLSKRSAPSTSTPRNARKDESDLMSLMKEFIKTSNKKQRQSQSSRGRGRGRNNQQQQDDYESGNRGRGRGRGRNNYYDQQQDDSEEDNRGRGRGRGYRAGNRGRPYRGRKAQY